MYLPQTTITEFGTISLLANTYMIIILKAASDPFIIPAESILLSTS